MYAHTVIDSIRPYGIWVGNTNNINYVVLFSLVFYSCQIYVVKTFYDQELEQSLRTMSRHGNATIISQFASNGTVNVALNNPSVPDNQIYPIQNVQLPSGLQFDHHPMAIYPHIHRNVAGSSSEQCPPQEYYNPPAYSPCYKPQNVRK